MSSLNTRTLTQALAMAGAVQTTVQEVTGPRPLHDSDLLDQASSGGPGPAWRFFAACPRASARSARRILSSSSGSSTSALLPRPEPGSLRVPRMPSSTSSRPSTRVKTLSQCLLIRSSPLSPTPLISWITFSASLTLLISPAWYLFCLQFLYRLH